MEIDLHTTGYIGFDNIIKVSRNPSVDETGVIERRLQK